MRNRKTQKVIEKHTSALKRVLGTYKHLEQHVRKEYDFKFPHTCTTLCASRTFGFKARKGTRIRYMGRFNLVSTFWEPILLKAYSFEIC